MKGKAWFHNIIDTFKYSKCLDGSVKYGPRRDSGCSAVMPEGHMGSPKAFLMAPKSALDHS